MFLDTSEIRPWLSARTDVTPFGVKLLNMLYSEEQMTQIVEAYSELARQLQSQPHITLALLRGEGGGWYSTIIGNVIVILQRNEELVIELANSIIKGNFAAPQLAAGFALATQGRGVTELEAFLDGAYKLHSDSHLIYPKGLLCAYTALKLLNQATAKNFEQATIFEQLINLDRDRCIERAERHYKIWQKVSPI